MEDLNTHIDKTYKSLTRKTRSTNPIQYVAFSFMDYDGRVWRDDKELFYELATEQGATTRHELELLGDPIYMDGVTFNKHWKKNLKAKKFLSELQFFTDENGGFSYYPIEQMKWTSHKELAKRKTPANLTSYGHQHFKDTYTAPIPVKRITAWNETKSANAWSKDARARVSDKIITRRISKGWTPEDAISSPPCLKN
jgi:hypothetical protein